MNKVKVRAMYKTSKGWVFESLDKSRLYTIPNLEKCSVKIRAGFVYKVDYWKTDCEDYAFYFHANEESERETCKAFGIEKDFSAIPTEEQYQEYLSGCNLYNKYEINKHIKRLL